MSRTSSIYCYSCEDDIASRSRSAVRTASSDEQRRMRNDKDYAHSWLQDVIGLIVELMGIISKIFSGGCYITTALVERKGLDDNCDEMNKFRFLRQNYVLSSNRPDLHKDLEEYYVLGQIIVNWANSRQDTEEIWDYIETYIHEVLTLINKGDLKKAYNLFKTKTLNIKRDIALGNHRSSR